MVESEIGLRLFQVTGTVTNTGNVSAQSVCAVATFYGTAGMLLILTLHSHLPQQYQLIILLALRWSRLLAIMGTGQRKYRG
jgi:hypothetical protein